MRHYVLLQIGLLYFFSCYLPVFNVWLVKIAYDSRYAPEDNLFHRSFEVFSILVLATIVQHIRPVDIMSDPSNATTLTFCVGLLAETLLSIHRQYDIYKNVDGGKEATCNAVHDMRRRVPTAIIYAAASVISLKAYLSPPLHEAEHHAPIICCLFAYLVEHMYTVIDRLLFVPPGRSHKEFFVPMNVEFTIHR